MALGVRGFGGAGCAGGRKEAFLDYIAVDQVGGAVYRVVLWVVVRILHYHRSVWGCTVSMTLAGQVDRSDILRP